MDTDCEFKETLGLLTLEIKSSKDSKLNQAQKLSFTKVKNIREQNDFNNHEIPYGGDNYAPSCIKETNKKVIKSYLYYNKSSISIHKSTVKLSVNPNTGQRQYKLVFKRKKITSNVYTTNSEKIGQISSSNKGKDNYYQVQTVKSTISLHKIEKSSYNYRAINEDLHIPIPCEYNMDRRSRSSRRDTAPIADSYYPFNEDYKNCAPCCVGAVPKLKPERSSIRIRGTFDVENNDLYLFKCSATPAKDIEDQKKNQKTDQSVEGQNWECECDTSSQPMRRSQGVQVCVRQSSLKSQLVQCNCKSITEIQQKYSSIQPNTLKVCESPLVIVSVYPNHAENSQGNKFNSAFNENKIRPVGETFGKKSFDNSASSQPKKKRNVSSPRRKKTSPSSSPSKQSRDNLKSPIKNKPGKEVYSKSSKTTKSSVKKGIASGGSSPRNNKKKGDSITQKTKIPSTKTGASKRDSSPLRKRHDSSQNAKPSTRQDLRSKSRSPLRTPRRSVSTSGDSSKSKKSGASLINPYTFTKRDPCYRSVSIISNDSAKEGKYRQSTNEPLKAFLAQRQLNLEKENENKNAKQSIYAYKNGLNDKNSPTASPQNKSTIQTKMPLQGGLFAKQYNQAYTSNSIPAYDQPNTSTRLSSPQNGRISNENDQEYLRKKYENDDSISKKKDQTSNIHINIDNKKEKYDVSLHRGTVLNDVMILKQVKDQAKRKVCRQGCPGTCSQKQTGNSLCMTADGQIQRSSSNIEYFPSLSFVSKKADANRTASVNQNNTEVETRQSRNFTNDAKPGQKRKTTKTKKNCEMYHKVVKQAQNVMNSLRLLCKVIVSTPERHYRGDDCITTEVLDRDREIRTLLGVSTTRDSNSQNFMEKVAEFLSMSSVDCIYDNCYLITKSSTSCNLLQNNILMRGNDIGNIVLNLDKALYENTIISREFNINNIISDKMKSVQELPCRNICFEYEASLQFRNRNKESHVHTSIQKDLVKDQLCILPSIVSCSIDVKQQNIYQAKNRIDFENSLALNKNIYHENSSQIETKQANIFNDRFDIFNNFDNPYLVSKINDVLLNELAIYQKYENYPMELNIPNEAFIWQLLYATKKTLKSRTSNLDPATMRSNHAQFICHENTKSYTANLESEFDSVDDFVEDNFQKEAPSIKISLKCFKRLFSCLKNIVTSSKRVHNDKSTNGSLCSIDSYLISSELAPLEATSSICDTSESYEPPQKSKRSFLGSARKLIASWKRSCPSEE